jgi:hypothetical protein
MLDDERGKSISNHSNLILNININNSSRLITFQQQEEYSTLLMHKATTIKKIIPPNYCIQSYIMYPCTFARFEWTPEHVLFSKFLLSLLPLPLSSLQILAMARKKSNLQCAYIQSIQCNAYNAAVVQFEHNGILFDNIRRQFIWFLYRIRHAIISIGIYYPIDISDHWWATLLLTGQPLCWERPTAYLDKIEFNGWAAEAMIEYWRDARL